MVFVMILLVFFPDKLQILQQGLVFLVLRRTAILRCGGKRGCGIKLHFFEEVDEVLVFAEVGH